MIRMVPIHCFLLAIAGTACAAPTLARDKPDKPRLTIEPIIARDLLAPAEPASTLRSPRLDFIDVERAGLLEPPPYRLERDGDAAAGKRAKLSVALGHTRLFAVSGKLSRRERPGPTDALETTRSNPLGPRRLENGRLYGGGVERSLGRIDLSATYQFSRINGTNLDAASDHGALDIDRKHKSQSVQLRARLRF